MDKFTKELIQNHLGSFMDRSRDKLASSDKLYKRDVEDSHELEKRYNALELGKKERILINDYIACLMTREHRMADISYMAGVSDTIKFLHSLDILKDVKEI